VGWVLGVGGGLEGGRGRVVLGALLPIALGHELSIVLVVIAVALTQAALPPHTVRLIAALALVAFGLYTLARPRRHPRGFGMRIGVLGLAAWSFLMSAAHGAGLMLAPVLLGLPLSDHYCALRQLGLTAGSVADVPAAARLPAMGIVAVLVYEKLGLRLLRRSWSNLDRAWSVVLLVAGLATLFSV